MKRSFKCTQFIFSSVTLSVVSGPEAVLIYISRVFSAGLWQPGDTNLRSQVFLSWDVCEGRGTVAEWLEHSLTTGAEWRFDIQNIAWARYASINSSLCSPGSTGWREGKGGEEWRPTSVKPLLVQVGSSTATSPMANNGDGATFTSYARSSHSTIWAHHGWGLNLGSIDQSQVKCCTNILYYKTIRHRLTGTKARAVLRMNTQICPLIFEVAGPAGVS